MQILLYQNTTENNRVDKTAYLTSAGTLSGALKEGTSVLNPSILIERDALPSCNYINIPEFGRYYFITNIHSVRNKLWQLDCLVDALMTYKDQIKQQTAIIARQENSYNAKMFDPLLPVKTGRQNEYIQLADPADARFGSNHITADRKCYVLLTARGGSV